MAQVSITLEGVDELKNAFDRFPDRARVLMTDLVAKTTFAARQRMVAGAPRGETGRLKNAIAARTRGMSGFVEVKDAHYWRFVEYGTRRMHARPFIRPARELEALAFAERIRQFGRQMERDFSAGRLL